MVGERRGKAGGEERRKAGGVWKGRDVRLGEGGEVVLWKEVGNKAVIM